MPVDISLTALFCITEQFPSLIKKFFQKIYRRRINCAAAGNIFRASKKFASESWSDVIGILFNRAERDAVEHRACAWRSRSRRLAIEIQIAVVECVRLDCTQLRGNQNFAVLRQDISAQARDIDTCRLGRVHRAQYLPAPTRGGGQAQDRSKNTHGSSARNRETR